MTLDKYTKFILTIIATGIISINFYLYKISFIEQANAAPNNMTVVATSLGKSMLYLFTADGKYGCQVYGKDMHEYKWTKTGCK